MIGSPIARAQAAQAATLYRPLGSGANDSANIAAALLRGPVQLYRRQLYTFTAPLVLKDYQHLFVEGAVLNINIPQVDGVSGAAFYAEPDRLGANVALAADVATGTTSFTVTSDPRLSGVAVGGYVCLAEAGAVNAAQHYRVKAISGTANPWTITVERKILLPFKAATAVAFASAPRRGIHVDGGGAEIIVITADRVIEAAGAWQCRFADMIIHRDDALSGLGLDGFAVSVDVGGYQTEVTGMEIDGGASAIIGGALESCESCTLGVQATNGKTGNATPAIYAYAGRNNVLLNCEGHGFDYGVALDQGGTEVYPSDDCEVIGGDFSDNAVTGVLLSGAQGWKVSSVTADRNGLYGFQQVTEGPNAPARNTVEASSFRSNTSHGIELSNGSSTTLNGNETSANGGSGLSVESGVATVAGGLGVTRVTSHRSNSNVIHGIDAHGDVAIVGYDADGNGYGGGNSGSALHVDGNARVTLDGYTLSATFDGTSYLVEVAGTVGVKARNGRTTMAGTGIKMAWIRNANAATDEWSDVVATGGGSSFGYFANVSGAVLKIDPRVDMSGTATPWTLTGTSSVDTQARAASFAVDASLTNAAAQYIAAGSRAAASTTAVSGAVVPVARHVAGLDVAFVGDASNASGQTATVKIQSSTDHGVTWADLSGATTGAIATTAGAHSASIAFAPVLLAEGTTLRAVLTPSALLSAALTSVVVSIK